MTRRSSIAKSLLGTVLIASIIVLAAAGAPQAVSAGSGGTVWASADANLRQGTPDRNYGGSGILRIQASGNNRALVRFEQDDIVDLVGGGTLVSACLEMYIVDNADNWGDGRTVDVHRLLAEWAEGDGDEKDRGTGAGATWNCPIDPEIADQKHDTADRWYPGQPQGQQGGRFDATPTDTITIEKDLLGWVSWDVTSDVAAFLSGAAPNYGWLIKKTVEGASGKAEFSSRQGDTSPRLIIEYEPLVREITLLGTKDTFLRSGAPNTNEGANTGLRIQASGDNRILVGFNLSGINLDGLQKATLVLTLMENADNWGREGDRTVDAHRLLADWAEGNGKEADMPKREHYRGDGAGATWWTGVDPEIANSKDDDAERWNPGLPRGRQGGAFDAATAPSVVFRNGLRGEVSWDVTDDVFEGADFGWLIKKTRENLSGKAIFYSIDGADEAGDPRLGPRLILEFGP